MPNALLEKSYTLAVLVVKLCTGPLSSRLDLSRSQLFRAGTSCGANVEEAQAAESPRDFAHKVGIATKEAHETCYWLRLARDSGLLPPETVKDPIAIAEEVIRLGHSIVAGTRLRPGFKAVLLLLLLSSAALTGYLLLSI